ncbi:NAD(P)HX epimerase / NAD(P)HX dehydratase [Fulvivirga imtechensis AK7]|uniref:Bifunctional NAD(P)H-hydrate repair enzyme n=1 Tax=Fulvivirga imtechensis AK7 TaxID=1237149 RepID=L8JQ39_9BACT|nr:bifunctional ADP-dependent NAD(P)H-hydrate dehydratase/NAD(P)H-hydrate epimerase [Fulvivirga imtechensis]ELR70298.1 NAD(P)HX epimerase / NAD(P)HX dehydratase [Fulvivirga imtechensis AK7]
MKILSAEQVREVDKYTIENEPIPSIDLMERAAHAFTDWLISHFSPKSKVAVICGTGNNGGDGLAVARMLLGKKYQVDTFAVKRSNEASADFKINEKRLNEIKPVREVTTEKGIPLLEEFDVIIDGLFGSGLSREVQGLHADVVEMINKSRKTVVSIDIPSGLFTDHHTFPGAVVEADYTLTFQVPKLAFFFPENAQYVGEWYVVDIGLSAEAIDQQRSHYYMLTSEMISKLLKPRKKFAHKGDHGRALIMSGSYGKMGAAVLCARAALRTGIGLLTMYIPTCGYDIIQSTVPEAMAIPDEGDHFLTSYTDLENYDAVGVGPGIGKEQETVYSLMQSIQTYKKPMVIDADGLNIISEHGEMLEILPKNTIITPHPKEFERLVGKWSDDFEKLALQKDFARKHDIIVVLKGAHTSVALPSGDIFFNSTGNPGMASGGSGDVLTGMITSLLGQGYIPEEAAKIGVFMHGLAADLAAEVIGEIGMVATDITDFIPEAYQQFK